MSNIHKDDIVEFFHENGESGYGYVIQVHQTDAIDALVVAVLDAYGKILMIPRHRVKETWRNLRGYVTDCQILQAEVERLKEKIERIKMLIAFRRDVLLNNIMKGSYGIDLESEYKALNLILEQINAPDTNAGGVGKQMKQITIYICDKCGEEFRKRSFCEQHEAECKAQNCEMCKHSIRVLDNCYRCEMFLLGKYCKFELRETK